MAQDEDRAEWTIDPWAGTIDQLRRAAGRCESKLAAAVPHPRGYDPVDESQRFSAAKHEEWRVAQEARSVAIKVVERDGFARRLTAVEDLDDLGLEQLDRIDGIDIDIGGGYANPSTLITASHDRGLAVRLVGPDRSWTAGLRHELEEILSPVGKLRPLPLKAVEAYFVIAALLFYGLLFGLGFYFRDRTDWSPLPRIAISFGVAFLVAALVASIGIRLPRLELLSTGEKPAYERWRSRILAAVGGALLSIAASLAAARIGG